MTTIQNSIWIHADRNTVFDRTNDIANWTELFTEYQESRVLEQTEAYIRFELTTYPEENRPARSWTSERWLDRPNFRITARRLAPLLPFKHMNLEWLYEEQNEGTYMTWIQEFEVDPASGLTGEQVEAHLNRTTKEQMAAIKQNIEQQTVRS
ncbi:SRPBCC family protein [Paenibacillus sp. FSL K6-1096]|uniref:SRPBCC family protein n=1 Tax=Paenibacillus sp. FSL K6-1096 TaxID=2921460 RepID=UPI0030EC15E6